MNRPTILLYFAALLNFQINIASDDATSLSHSNIAYLKKTILAQITEGLQRAYPTHAGNRNITRLIERIASLETDQMFMTAIIPAEPDAPARISAIMNSKKYLASKGLIGELTTELNQQSEAAKMEFKVRRSSKRK